MISVFDLKKLQSLLKDFYTITRIRITVFDENRIELVSYPGEIADFCKIVRSTESGRIACAACDQMACRRAARQRRTQIYRCHAGLTEAVTPLIVNGVLAGYLFFGHVLAYPDHESGWEEIRRCTADLPVDREALHKACLERPLISEDYVRSATQILLAVANYLAMERIATLQADQLAVQLDRYLSEHFAEPLRAVQICKRFGIGKTQLYRISEELYGCGVAEHIRDLRMEKARELLRDGEGLTLSEIAARCGYSDYNYFISVFSRQTGMPPGSYRRSLAGR